MKSVKNIIDKIFLDFEYKFAESNIVTAAEKTRAFFYDNLLPRIDALLEKKGGEKNIRIDAITIDLDKTRLEDLPDRILEALEAAIDAHDSITLEQHKLTGHSTGSGEIDEFLFFLQSGQIPWHADKQEYPTALLTRLYKEHKAATLLAMKMLFNKSTVSLERFVLQFTEQQIVEAFAFYVDSSSFKAILIAWLEFVLSKQDTGHVTKIFDFAITNESLKNSKTFTETFTKELVLPFLNTGNSLFNQVQQELQNIITEQQQLQTITTQTEKLQQFYKELVKKYSSKHTIDAKASQAIDSDAKENAYAPDNTTKEDNIAGDVATTTSFAVGNAGLVILYPYLQAFFTELKLIDKEAFINTSAQTKAAQVLQYIATGTLKTPEHLLALNKILCGIDTAMPCPGRLRLTKQEKEACEILLNAVIRNWKSIGSTSIAGLRQSFIQRNGVIKKDGDNWILHVEHKGYDILLDDMPWGFRLLKFPWNEYFVHVQW